MKAGLLRCSEIQRHILFAEEIPSDATHYCDRNESASAESIYEESVNDLANQRRHQHISAPRDSAKKAQRYCYRHEPPAEHE